MEPKIHVGDTIITMPFKCTSTSISISAMLSLSGRKALTSHRIISIKGDSIVTKVTLTKTPTPAGGNCPGKSIYLFKIPYIGYLSYFIRTKLGWFLLIIVPLYHFCLIIIEIIKETFKSKPAEGQAIAGRMSNIRLLMTMLYIEKQ